MILVSEQDQDPRPDRHFRAFGDACRHPKTTRYCNVGAKRIGELTGPCLTIFSIAILAVIMVNPPGSYNRTLLGHAFPQEKHAKWKYDRHRPRPN